MGFLKEPISFLFGLFLVIYPYTYDASNNLTYLTLPNGQVVNYQYDSARNLTIVDRP